VEQATQSGGFVMDEWLDEMESFSTRRERLRKDFAACQSMSYTMEKVKEWMQEAYLRGHADANK
jgi:hypothetical protein